MSFANEPKATIRKVGEVGMTEADKLLVRIGTARDAISRKTEQTSLDYMIDGVLMNCAVMLKEQQEQIWELQDQVEYLTDKLKEQETKNVVNMTLSKDCFLIASCPKCNALLTRVEHKKYCGYCGQAVKWE